MSTSESRYEDMNDLFESDLAAIDCFDDDGIFIPGIKSDRVGDQEQTTSEDGRSTMRSGEEALFDSFVPQEDNTKSNKLLGALSRPSVSKNASNLSLEEVDSGYITDGRELSKCVSRELKNLGMVAEKEFFDILHFNMKSTGGISESEVYYYLLGVKDGRNRSLEKEMKECIKQMRTELEFIGKMKKDQAQYSNILREESDSLRKSAMEVQDLLNKAKSPTFSTNKTELMIPKAVQQEQIPDEKHAREELSKDVLRNLGFKESTINNKEARAMLRAYYNTKQLEYLTGDLEEKFRNREKGRFMEYVAKMRQGTST
ncbi:TPA_asm: P [Anthurium amnicola virus 1]|uniref:P n=1 Tax=Anthurium amnicola virus 1 TaxID=2793721 RepID=A0A8D9PGX4_9RHAB|nr:P [Anthurium amnicola virus 1] [Anthurium amnicola virus 1]DAF42310.1 TPA_asm: P [Anthurium amnicola virus 1]